MRKKGTGSNFAVLAKFLPVPFLPRFKQYAADGQNRSWHEFRKDGEIQASPGFA